MKSSLMQELRLEIQLNELLRKIEYQLENIIECSYKTSFICNQCIYNVGDIVPICIKKETT